MLGRKRMMVPGARFFAAPRSSVYVVMVGNVRLANDGKFIFEKSLSALKTVAAWCALLRNHDELNFSHLIEEQRQRVFAAATIFSGISRRYLADASYLRR